LLYGKQYQKIVNAAKIKLPDGCAEGEVMDPISFLANFNSLYAINFFQKDLVVLMLQGIVACFNGCWNAPLVEKVLNFYHMLESKSCAVLGVVAANMYEPLLRHIVHLQHKTVSALVTDFSEEMIRKCILKISEQVFASGQHLDCIDISIVYDATAVPGTIQLSSQYNAVIGGAAPHYLWKLDSDSAILQWEFFLLHLWNQVEY